jgi:CheY-like chemotaxis protein
VNEQPQATVLVLEDSDDDFDTLESAYRRAGMRNRLQRAVNGEECLDLLQRRDAERLHPSLVLLDLNTPGMDGRQALAAIRADPALRSVPVVILSTSTNPRDVAYCYAHGANAYHVKLVRYAEHLQLLADIFSYWLTVVTLPRRMEATA